MGTTLAPDLPPFFAFEAFQLVNTLAQSLDRVLQIVDRDELYSPHQSRSLIQRSLLQIDWLFFAAVILRIAAPLVAEYSTGRLLYSYYLSLLSIHGVTICLGLLPLLGRSLSLTLGTRSPSCVSSAECTDELTDGTNGCCAVALTDCCTVCVPLCTVRTIRPRPRPARRAGARTRANAKGHRDVHHLLVCSHGFDGFRSDGALPIGLFRRGND